jgi:hypothetical protein
MAMTRTGLPFAFSGGFNPLPRLEIASPLSIGVEGRGEIGSVETVGHIETGEFIKKINRVLPSGIRLLEGLGVFVPPGHKKHAVSSLLWGFLYANKEGADLVPREDEKNYRLLRTGEGDETGGASRFYGLRRLKLLVKRPGTDGAEGFSFFDVFRELYGD